jgi:hypothetical protein
MPVLVCHDEVVVECDIEQVVGVRLGWKGR